MALVNYVSCGFSINGITPRAAKCSLRLRATPETIDFAFDHPFTLLPQHIADLAEWVWGPSPRCYESAFVSKVTRRDDVLEIFVFVVPNTILTTTSTLLHAGVVQFVQGSFPLTDAEATPPVSAIDATASMVSDVRALTDFSALMTSAEAVVARSGIESIRSQVLSAALTVMRERCMTSAWESMPHAMLFAAPASGSSAPRRFVLSPRRVAPVEVGDRSITFLCDSPGTGKTFAAMLLVAIEPVIKKKIERFPFATARAGIATLSVPAPYVSASVDQHRVSRSLMSARGRTLIVVAPPMVEHWSGVARRVLGSAARVAIFDKTQSPEHLASQDVVIMSVGLMSRCFTHLMSMPSSCQNFVFRDRLVWWREGDPAALITVGGTVVQILGPYQTRAVQLVRCFVQVSGRRDYLATRMSNGSLILPASDLGVDFWIVLGTNADPHARSRIAPFAGSTRWADAGSIVVATPALAERCGAHVGSDFSHCWSCRRLRGNHSICNISHCQESHELAAPLMVEWQRVIVDDAHQFRREASSRVAAIASLRCRSLVCITSMPEQIPNVIVLKLCDESRRVATPATVRALVRANSVSSATMEDMHVGCEAHTHPIACVGAMELSNVVRQFAIGAVRAPMYLQRWMLALGRGEAIGQTTIAQHLQLHQDVFTASHVVDEGALSGPLTCQICFEDADDGGDDATEWLALRPCMHAICRECLNDMNATSASRRCALCRGGIDTVARIVRAGATEEDAKSPEGLTFQGLDKLETVVPVVSGFAARGEKTVIFTMGDEARIQRIARALRAAGVDARPYGRSMSAAQRDVSLNVFRGAGNVLVLSFRSVNMHGIDLRCASHIVFLDVPLRPSMVKSAVSRTLGFGRVASVAVHAFPFDNSFESFLWERLRREELNAMHHPEPSASPAQLVHEFVST